MQAEQPGSRLWWAALAGHPASVAAGRYPEVSPATSSFSAMFVTAGLWDSQVQYHEPAKYVARQRGVPQLRAERNPTSSST